MRVISNAMLYQSEVTQVDRWAYGPLEIRFMPERRDDQRHSFGGRVSMWNRGQCAGFLRGEESQEAINSLDVRVGGNPNIVIAPTCGGYSELLGMLGSLLPERILLENSMERPTGNFWLWPLTEQSPLLHPSRITRYSFEEIDRIDTEHLQSLARILPGIFENWIWSRLVASNRYRFNDFDVKSSVRLLAGDARFWMHRLYRIAINLYEQLPPTTHEDDWWQPLSEIEGDFEEWIAEQKERGRFQLARPRVGSILWDADDENERERITDLLINGDATIQSLEPVIEVLLGSATHDDFSNRYSWVKEDFERAFYSKRSRVKIKLCEFTDDCPVHDGSETPGYENILFRDLMAFFDKRDRTIILALRQGRTQSEIAEQLGHSGHAAISRRIKIIETKMRRLLRDE